MIVLCGMNVLADSDLAEALHELGLGLLPWSALAGGRLWHMLACSVAHGEEARASVASYQAIMHHSPHSASTHMDLDVLH